MGHAAQAIAKRSFSIEARERAYEAVYQASLSKKFWRWDSMLPGLSKNL
jgi:hypothetical protein